MSDVSVTIEGTAELCPCDCSRIEDTSQGVTPSIDVIAPTQTVSYGSVNIGIVPYSFTVQTVTATAWLLRDLGGIACMGGSRKAVIAWRRESVPGPQIESGQAELDPDQDKIVVSYTIPEDCLWDFSFVNPRRPPTWSLGEGGWPFWETIIQSQYPDGVVVQYGVPQEDEYPRGAMLETDLRTLYLVPGASVGLVEKYWDCNTKANISSPIYTAYFATMRITGGYIKSKVAETAYQVVVNGAEYRAYASDYQDYSVDDWVFLVPMCCERVDNDPLCVAPDPNFKYNSDGEGLLSTGPFLIIPIDVGGAKAASNTIFSYAQGGPAWDGLLDGYCLVGAISYLNKQADTAYVFGRVLPIKYIRRHTSSFSGGSKVFIDNEKAMVFFPKFGDPSQGVIFSPCKRCPVAEDVYITAPTSTCYYGQTLRLDCDETASDIKRGSYTWRIKPDAPQGATVSPTDASYTIVTPMDADTDGYTIVEMLCEGEPMEERQVNFACPPAGATSINHSTHTMLQGETQGLSSMDGKSYAWRVSPTDAGSLSVEQGSSTVFTAGALQDSNCSKNATISLVCRPGTSQETTIASMTIAISKVSNYTAYERCITCYVTNVAPGGNFPPNYNRCDIYSRRGQYNCIDVLVWSDSPTPAFSGVGQGPICDSGDCSQNYKSSMGLCGTNPGGTIDLRTTYIKSLGCCPAALAGLL